MTRYSDMADRLEVMTARALAAESEVAFLRSKVEELTALLKNGQDDALKLEVDNPKE